MCGKLTRGRLQARAGFPGPTLDKLAHDPPRIVDVPRKARTNLGRINRGVSATVEVMAITSSLASPRYSPGREWPSTTGSGELPPRQERALVALLHSASITEAASLSGVSERTLRRWIGDEAFRAAFRTARREVTDRAFSNLASALHEAVETLRRNLRAASANTQVRAAVGLLGIGLRAIDQLDLAERIEALEEHAEMNRQ